MFSKTLLVLFLCLAPLCWGAKLQCPICGMNFDSEAKTAYFIEKDKEETGLCSYACAHRAHGKDHSIHLKATDFVNGKHIPVESSYFIAKSKNILKELPFDMPPSVVAFSNEKDAQATQKRLQDGVVLKGWKSLEKTYE